MFINYDRGTTATPQPTSSEGFSSYKLDSKLMGREMPYRVMLPLDYKDNSAARYPVIYLLHGLTGHFNDWTDRSDLVKEAGKYNFIIVTPEGNDGWYSDNPAVPNDKYESYVVSELVTEIDKRFRTLADRQHRIIAGLSMGGYGSLKFGLKFPDRFSIVGSFSGALRIADWSEKVGGNRLIGRSVDVVFGPIKSEARNANDVFRLARELTPEKVNGLPYIYLSCGTSDPMLEGNVAFNKILNEKGVRHDYRTSPGGHDWIFWGSEVKTFLHESDRLLKSVS